MARVAPLLRVQRQQRQRQCGSTRQRAVRGGDGGAVRFVPGELIDVETNVAPLMIDTPTVTEEGLYSLDPVEHAMLEGVVRDSGSRGEASAQNSRRTTDTGSSGTVSDTIDPDESSGFYAGCRDVESLTPPQRILPYGSQFRRTRCQCQTQPAP